MPLLALDGKSTRHAEVKDGVRRPAKNGITKNIVSSTIHDKTTRGICNAERKAQDTAATTTENL